MTTQDKYVMDKDLMILEYKESKGQWHYNMVKDHKPKDKPDSYGWASIAFTEERKARVFTYMMDCKMHQREREGLEPYPTQYIKKEWKLFCYVYNTIIKTIEITDDDKKLVAEKFDDIKSLARLGHAGFSDVMDDYDLEPAENYNPLDFMEANF